MNTCGCDLHVLYLEVRETCLVISRCSNFNSHPENYTKIAFNDIPQEDDKLKELIFNNINRPKTFRNLTSQEKLCNTNCEEVFNHNITHVVINTFGCNLHCQMCYFTDYELTSKMKELYKRLCNLFISTDFEIAFTHRGEPFLFHDVIENYFKHKRSFSCISNLTLIREEDIDLLAKNNCSILSSIDSTDETIYRSIRTPASHSDYEKVLSIATKLANAGVLKCNLITITTQNLNLNDLAKTFKFFKNLNVFFQIGVDVANVSYNHPIIVFLQKCFPDKKYWRN